jgi:membrane-associated protease RseP (regulator of RpoE activity)
LNWAVNFGSPPGIGLGPSACQFVGATSDIVLIDGLDYARTISKDLILLAPQVVHKVEAAKMRKDAQRPAPNDTEIFRIAECAIMHELIHWSAYWLGIDEKQKYGSYEYATTRFEIAAYGRRLRIPTDWICTGVPKANAPVLGAILDDHAVVTKFMVGSPAKKAGLKSGQRISKIDGKPMDSGTAVDEYIYGQKKPGETVLVEVIEKNGASTRLSIVLGKLADVVPDE